MLEKLKAVEDRYNEMAERAAQPDFYADPQAAAKLLREQRQLEPLMNAYRSYCKTRQEAQDLREMLDGEAIEKAAREGDSAALQGMLRQVLATREGQTLAQRLRKVMEGK